MHSISGQWWYLSPVPWSTTSAEMTHCKRQLWLGHLIQRQATAPLSEQYRSYDSKITELSEVQEQTGI